MSQLIIRIIMHVLMVLLCKHDDIEYLSGYVVAVWVSATASGHQAQENKIAGNSKILLSLLASGSIPTR